MLGLKHFSSNLRLILTALLLSSCASSTLRDCGIGASKEGMPYAYKSAKSSASSTAAVPIAPPGPLPHDYEEATLEKVFPDGSTTFDPFTFGRPGSPYGINGPFSPTQTGGRCGPMQLPMSSQFADPGDKQAVILIFNNGQICQADIDHDKPGAALSFLLLGAPFTNPPWTLVSNVGGKITIRDAGSGVTIRFTFSVSSDFTTISQVEYL